MFQCGSVRAIRPEQSVWRVAKEIVLFFILPSACEGVMFHMA